MSCVDDAAAKHAATLASQTNCILLQVTSNNTPFFKGFRVITTRDIKGDCAVAQGIVYISGRGLGVH